MAPPARKSPSACVRPSGTPTIRSRGQEVPGPGPTEAERRGIRGPGTAHPPGNMILPGVSNRGGPCPRWDTSAACGMMAVIMGSQQQEKQFRPSPNKGNAASPQPGQVKRLYSTGHSNHDLGPFVELLRNGGVTAVADVRSAPFSQRYPQFNRPDLESGLAQHGIRYLFYGDSLGGRPRGTD